MPRRLVVIVGSLFLTLALCLTSWCKEVGVIEGIVINGTEGDAPVADVSVTLLTWQEDEQLEPQTATTNVDGLFQFTDLEIVGHLYRLMVEYEEITYGFEPKTFPPDGTLISIPLTVYEATTADGTLVVDRAHLIITRDVDVLLVQEVLVFVNESARTYLGPAEDETRGTIRFVLPQSAANVEWLGGFPAGSIAISSEGFDFVLPVLPGSAEFTFSYTLPLTEASYSLEKVFTYATRHVDIFARSGAVKLTAPQLTEVGPVAMMDGSYSHFSGDDLSAGTTLGVTLEHVESPHEHPAPTEERPKFPTGVVIALVGVLILFVLIYPFLRRRGRRAG